MEKEKGRLIATLNSPEFYASYDAAKLREANDRLEALGKGLDEPITGGTSWKLCVRNSGMLPEVGSTSIRPINLA